MYCTLTPFCSKDHPRTRGEKQYTVKWSKLALGSPPHTRGKASADIYRLREARITPAHAGKSSALPLKLRDRGDHPRTRGEKRTSDLPEPEPAGSPPHTRGKVMLKTMQSYQGRITPAHAGKSDGQQPLTATAQDHPRTRGEKRDVFKSLCCQVGSPPHTRGKVQFVPDGEIVTGITPAHAGKSVTKNSCFLCCWDHPRTRGEKVQCKTETTAIVGSPPHTRGKVLYN